MRVLFFNQSFIENKNAHIWTGPSGGSCWPHTQPGLYCYVPFCFFLSNATSYLRAHGIDADMYDSWAHRETDLWQIRTRMISRKPDMLVIECNTPNIVQLLETAEWAKSTHRPPKIVLVGPHVHAYADELLALPYVDHVVAGEYDLACLKIAQGDTRRKIEHEYVADIDNVNGQNWLPYRDPATLANYLDPSMIATPIQLQVNTSRGCNYACSFCSWPAVMYRRRHARSAENVLDEIRTVMQSHRIGSIFFDDEMFNAGDPARLKTLCAGLKEIGLPWSFMGRIDTSKEEQWEMFVASGCAGFRVGIESFHQHLLDRVNKKLNVEKSRNTCWWLLTHFSGLHVRLLTMKSLPGETADEEASDLRAFEQLQALGHRHGNRVDLQRTDCVALPGTPLWNELRAAGQGAAMENFSEYDAHPDHGAPLAKRLDTYAVTVKGAAV